MPLNAEIANLMVQAGRDRAAGIAGAGEAWARAISQIGQQVGQIPQQIEAQKQMADAQRARDARGELSDAMKATSLNPDGTINIPAIAQHMTAKGFGPEFAPAADHLDRINQSIMQVNQSRQNLIRTGAAAVQAAGNDPKLAHSFLDTLKGIYPDDKLQEYRDFLDADPSNTAKLTAFLAGPQKPVVLPPTPRGGAPAVAINPNTLDTMATGGMPEPSVPTEAELALRAARGDASAQGAMSILKPNTVKPGTVEDWVARARRLAIAQNGGKPLTDEQTQATDAAALQEFKTTNADPEMRAMMLAQKDMATALARIQLSQQPTKEDAESVATAIRNHTMAPSQMQLFGGFGAAGAAFKRMVGAELIKQDPNFNWEEAESNYNLVKSPSFQNTVRYMDSVAESIPRLQQNALKLGNGQFKAWNQIVNASKEQFNSADVRAFKTDVALVGDEVAKILQGGGTGSGTSDAKLKQAQDLFKTSDDVPAMAAAVNEVQALIGFRRKALTRGTYLEGASSSAAPAKTPTEKWDFVNGVLQKVSGD